MKTSKPLLLSVGSILLGTFALIYKKKKSEQLKNPLTGKILSIQNNDKSIGLVIDQVNGKPIYAVVSAKHFKNKTSPSDQLKPGKYISFIGIRHDFSGKHQFPKELIAIRDFTLKDSAKGL